MNRRVLWIALAIAAVFLFGYFASPYLAASQLKAAVLAADADQLEKRVDFPAVRESLKSQLSAALLAKLQNDPEMKANPFAGLGVMMMPAIVDKAVDAYVTPEGLRAMAKGGKPGNPNATLDAEPNPDLVYTSEYVSLNRFRIKMKKKSTDELGPSFLFERRGLMSWILIKVELPEELFNKP